jgi:hypothetical protein
MTEGFHNSTVDTSIWHIGGSAALTAEGDGEGNGWLRLTPAINNRFGYAYNSTAFPSTDGLLVDFDYADWGGNGADGTVFFLYDGATGTFAPGPAGGSLG